MMKKRGVMKKIIEFFIKKPAFTHVLFLIVIISSIIAYKNVPKELFPPSTLDKIIIQGAYPGASPETLDKMAVSQIEDEVKNYPEVVSVESVISNGNFVITVSLKPNSNKLELLSDFKTIVSNLKKDLPSDMSEPSVSILKKAFPLMFISVGSETLSKDELTKIAEDVQKKLSRIKNLTKVEIRGNSDKNIYFELDNQKIESLGINKKALIGVLSGINTIFPVGKIESTHQYFISMFPQGIKDFNSTIIKIGNKIVRLRDIAKIKEEYAIPTQIGKYNGVPTLTIDVRKGESGDAIALSKKIREFLKEYHKKHPEVIFGISTDTSKWVRNRFNTVVSNIIFGLILVFFVMWLFLNWRISLVVTLGIPTSFAIALIYLDYANLSLNLLSMLGALIALGMIVDEAIVVGENIYRHMEMGKDKIKAAVDGTIEVFWPVVAAAMTTILAFMPLLLIKGEIGVFIKILPLMITILIFSSLIEAFVFLPLHSKEILKVEHSKKEIFWEKFQNVYKKILFFFFKFRYIVLFFFLIVVPYLTIQGFKHSKFQLFPTFDTSQIYVNGAFDSNYTITHTANAIRPIEKILKKYLGDNVEGFTTVVGMKMNNRGEANNGENYFHIFVDLKDRKPTDFYNKYIAPIFQPIKIKDQTRVYSAYEIASMLKKDFKNIKILGLKELNVIVPQAGVVKSDVVISIASNDSKKVISAIKTLEEEMKKIKGVYNIYDDAELGAYEVKIKLNKYGESLGFNENEIFSQIRAFFGESEYAKTFNKDGIVRIILKDKNKDSFNELKNFRLVIPNTNQLIELNKISTFVIERNFKKIHKYNGIAAKSVYASLNKKIITTTEFYKKINPLLEKFKKEGLKIIIGGAAKTSKEFMKDLKEALVVAVLLIFLILVLMFDSIILPFVIISVIPLSFLGVIIGNNLMGINMTMLGMIGIVGLAGVVVNDGIVMIDFIKKAKNLEEVLIKASHRLRPILLTSITTFFGLTTLMFFPFGQAAILQPLAIALGFGLVWGTLLNLFYLPVFYYILNKNSLINKKGFIRKFLEKVKGK
ncbi:efflux RND transporter permease subunit [Caminibacter mediatlanticus TB-2]|uniref:Efflux RND transporter permease subunit n=2 Tax=Caminibacter mediatlanticus TaxID=291048 RepID=A0ABX5VB84_9BACT|nr:efflux RND transporter permease subunit [Caminibacter mediatlanticus TB-2]